MMDIEKLRALRNAKPFHSFVVKLADGRQFTVQLPQYIGFTPRNVVLISAPEGTAWFAPSQVSDVVDHNTNAVTQP